MHHAQVQAVVRSVLGAEVAPDAPLMSAGLDSLGAVELKSGLEGALSLALPGTLVFDCACPGPALQLFVMQHRPRTAHLYQQGFSGARCLFCLGQGLNGF